MQYQLGANLMPVQGQLFGSLSILQFPKMVNIPVQQQFSNQPILANPCQSANPVPIQCQSANPRPIGQSQANPMPLLRAIPALNQGTSPLWRLVSSPLGGRIQDNRAFPILTNPIQCWPTHANAGQSGANPWLIRVHLHS